MIELQTPLDGIGHPLEAGPIEQAFGGGRESEIALRHRPARVLASDAAQGDGAARRADRLHHRACVCLATNAVEDGGGDIQGRIEAFEAQHRRRGAARLGGGVDDEDDRCAEPLGDLRGRSGVAAGVGAIEAAHDTLDDRDVGVRRVTRDGGHDGLATAHPTVEVVRGPAAGHRVQTRVDEVGPDLERLHDEPAAPERSQQPKRDRRLADAARGTGDDEDARHAGPSTPADLNVAISA